MSPPSTGAAAAAVMSPREPGTTAAVEVVGGEDRYTQQQYTLYRHTQAQNTQESTPVRMEAQNSLDYSSTAAACCCIILLFASYGGYQGSARGHEPHGQAEEEEGRLARGGRKG